MDRLVQRTLKLDLLRSIPLGFIESIGSTFGVLILVRVFAGDQVSKAWVVAAGPIGLLVGLFVVQWVRRSGILVGRAMALLHLLSAVGFAMIALLGDTIWFYVIGILIGAIGLASALPLMSQIYREHYPDEQRGKLFSYGGVARKIAAIGAALMGGWLLKQDLGNYKLLFALFAGACVLMAIITTRFDDVRLDTTRRTRLFYAFRHVRDDKEFRDLLVSWMFLGVGNLLCMALFVEYISNREYGYNYDEFTIGMITTFVPEAVYLCVVMLWGRLFDRWNFYLLRASINLFFAAGILVYFLGHGIWFLCIGIGLHGVAKAGGNVAWSLWVTKFSKPQHVAEYMSVHTFLTGCRGLASPFISLPLVMVIPAQWIAISGALLILFATGMIAPKVRFETKRRVT